MVWDPRKRGRVLIMSVWLFASCLCRFIDTRWEIITKSLLQFIAKLFENKLCKTYFPARGGWTFLFHSQYKNLHIINNNDIIFSILNLILIIHQIPSKLQLKCFALIEILCEDTLIIYTFYKGDTKPQRSYITYLLLLRGKW